MSEQLRKQASGLDNWVVTTHAEPYLTAFQDKLPDLVYLTAGLWAVRQPLSVKKTFFWVCMTVNVSVSCYCKQVIVLKL